MYINYKIYIRMSVAALFIITQTGKNQNVYQLENI